MKNKMPRLPKRTENIKRSKTSPLEGASLQMKIRKLEKENLGDEEQFNHVSDRNMPIQKIEISSVASSTAKFSPSPRKDEILHSEESEDDLDQDTRISAYEKLRQENIKANEEFFSQLGIFEAKENLKEASEKRKAKPSQRGIKREKSPPPPRRSSLRLKRMEPSGTPLPPLPEPLIVQDEHARPPPGPLQIQDYLYGNTKASHCDRLREKIQTSAETTDNVHPLKAKPTLDSSMYIKAMAKTKLTTDRVAKVVPDRIFSVAIHPTCDKVLVAAGGKWGSVGLWDVNDVEDDQQGVATFAPHSRPVNNLSFPTWHQNRLYSCSYDGSLRCAHFDKGVFEEVYTVSDDNDALLRNFDFLCPETMLVSQSDGCVAQIDQRTPGTGFENIYSLHSKSLRSVSIHPLQKNCFITSCTNGDVSLWDIRKLKKGFKKTNSSIVDLHHGKGVNSAYFSPLNGNFILTTSYDDRISLFDSSTLTANISLKKAIRHNNFTGRWLTNFRAAWHPARDDTFVVGSMERPRRIEMFNVTGNIIQTFSDEECLGSVCSINALHPTQPVLVGGNSSGRLHVFM